MTDTKEIRSLADSIPEKKYFILLILLACVTFFGALEIRPLEGGDETRVAGISAEIALNGNWIVPKLNGKPFLEYPPLYYWLDAVAFWIFGKNDFAAKLPSVLGGLLSIVSVRGIARRFQWSGFYAFLCGAMLLFSAQFFEKARTCMVDGLLAGFVACAVWMFLESDRSEKFVRKAGYLFLFSLACAGGMYTKGMLGTILPCAMIGPWILAEDLFQKKFSFSRYFLLGIGAVLSCVPLLFWIFALRRELGPEAVYEVVVINNFGRFTGSQGDHVVSYFYYLKKLPAQFAPWTILLPFALWRHFRTVWTGAKNGMEFSRSLFVLLALLTPYLLLTIASGKRQVYLLPLYSMEALLIGSMAADYLTGKAKIPFRIPHAEKFLKMLPDLLALFLAGSGSVFLIGCPAYASLFPVLTILAGGILASLRGNGKLLPKILVSLFGAALLFASLDTGPLYNPDGEKAYHLKFAKLRGELLKNPGRVVFSGPVPERLSGAAVYYLGHTVPFAEKPVRGDIVLGITPKREIFWKRIQ